TAAFSHSATSPCRLKPGWIFAERFHYRRIACRFTTAVPAFTSACKFFYPPSNCVHCRHFGRRYEEKRLGGVVRFSDFHRSFFTESGEGFVVGLSSEERRSASRSSRPKNGAGKHEELRPGANRGPCEPARLVSRGTRSGASDRSTWT